CIAQTRLEYHRTHLIRNQTNPTIALLAQNDGIIARLTVKAETDKQANDLLLDVEEKIESKVGQYFIGTGYQTIENKVVSMLKEKKITVAAAESLTGGMFTEKIINISGASQVCPGGIIAYSPQIKVNVLGVSSDIIE